MATTAKLTAIPGAVDAGRTYAWITGTRGAWAIVSKTYSGRPLSSEPVYRTKADAIRAYNAGTAELS